jgi:hypothetical protein
MERIDCQAFNRLIVRVKLVFSAGVDAPRGARKMSLQTLLERLWQMNAGGRTS